MACGKGETKTVVIMNAKYWDSVQQELLNSIEELNRITGKIAAHHHIGAWEAEDLVEYTDRKVREIRKALEAIVSPI